MSSNNHDNNNSIHLGNYEEYFLLYTDGELTEAEMNMVDSFVAAHPDLRGELELLMDTRLTPETFSFDKEMLMADKMQLPSANEDLLLYIDQELPAQQKHVVELELSANTEYANLYSQLLKTKLDAGEVVAHPNKNELYKRSGNIVAFRPWMRVAAAVLLIAGATAVYTSTQHTQAHVDVAAVTPAQTKQDSPRTLTDNGTTAAGKTSTEETKIPIASETGSLTAALTAKDIRKSTSKEKTTPEVKPEEKEELVINNRERMPQQTLSTETTAVGLTPVTEIVTLGNNPNLINKSLVTNSVTEPLNSIVTAAGEVKSSSPVASNEKKGSVKGFLRKATRLIEKKTGIDPTNDGELLIGVVAVNLN